MPYLYSYVNVMKETMPTQKAFYDIPCEDAEVWAHWVASAFEKQQHHQAFSNGYLPGAEPMKLDLGTSISHDLDSKVDKTDIMAVLRRTHIVVLGDNAVYFKLAGVVHIQGGQ
eukprot:1127072-Amphidinium_carterae.2